MYMEQDKTRCDYGSTKSYDVISLNICVHMHVNTVCAQKFEHKNSLLFYLCHMSLKAKHA